MAELLSKTLSKVEELQKSLNDSREKPEASQGTGAKATESANHAGNKTKQSKKKPAESEQGDEEMEHETSGSESEDDDSTMTTPSGEVVPLILFILTNHCSFSIFHV